MSDVDAVQPTKPLPLPPKCEHTWVQAMFVDGAGRFCSRCGRHESVPPPETPLPCPKCGAFGSRLTRAHDEDTGFWWLECHDCNSPGLLAMSESEAISAWNRRCREKELKPPKPPERVEHCGHCGSAIVYETWPRKQQIRNEEHVQRSRPTWVRWFTCPTCYGGGMAQISKRALDASEYEAACEITERTGCGKVFAANVGTAKTITKFEIEGGTVEYASKGLEYLHKVPLMSEAQKGIREMFLDAATAAKRLRACCQVHKGAFHWTPPKKSWLRRWWERRRCRRSFRMLRRAGKRLERRLAKQAKIDKREKAEFRQRCDLWDARETAAYVWDAITDVQADRTAADRKETTKKAWAVACKIVTPRKMRKRKREGWVLD